MDRGAWWATSTGSQRVGHGGVTNTTAFHVASPSLTPSSQRAAPITLFLCLSSSHFWVIMFSIYVFVGQLLACFPHRQLRNLSCSVPSTEPLAWHEIGDRYILAE